MGALTNPSKAREERGVIGVQVEEAKVEVIFYTPNTRTSYGNATFPLLPTTNREKTVTSDKSIQMRIVTIRNEHSVQGLSFVHLPRFNL